jgi:hypothetical protein
MLSADHTKKSAGVSFLTPVYGIETGGFSIMSKRSVTLLSASLVVLALSVSTVSAQSGRNGQVHIQKDCKDYDGSAGSHCTIVVSNLPEIPVSSNIYYDQALGVPTGLLDSNIVLDAGNGNRAVGRCTLVLSTGKGLCTFSDGIGQLAGFTARVDVSFVGGTLWAFDGTYSFSPLPPR